jgi:hypothetical protein
MALRNLFDPSVCVPRPDVLQGTTRDEQFAADLAQVVNRKAPPEYGDPATFFSNTFPTRGIQHLMKAVCTRLSGKGGEVSPLIRLHTQFGGGKTHGLIALVHAVRGGAAEIPNIAAFVDPELLPTSPVRVAALDGENTDPANGRLLEPGIRAKTLWGELAYQLGGRDGFESVRASDEQHVAPGASTLGDLFGGQPALILMDEIAVYLRKVEAARPGASKQFTAFIQALFKAVSTSPNVALVFTLALGKDSSSTDAYKDENVLAARVLDETASVAARNSTQINPTDEDETADVLRTRLFASFDPSAAAETAAAYAAVWARNRENLPADANSPTLKDQFKKTWPLHPKTVELLTEKTSSLSTFQRTRGMLRLLVRTVHYLWRQKPDQTYAIHPHHIDPAYLPIRDEITVRLGQESYISALKADVASVAGEEPALAQRLDRDKYPGLPPVTSYIATTIFLHTLAYGDGAKGISAEQLKVDICSPSLEPTFIEQARVAFVAESIYLDDRRDANLRFMVEPNLTMMVRKQMAEIDPVRIREQIRIKLDSLFKKERGDFQLRLFPRSPGDVPDDFSDERPLLAVMDWETLSIPSDLRALPTVIAELFQTTGSNATPRVYRNNVIFLAADERNTLSMTEATRRFLALEDLATRPERQPDLADYQKKEIARRLSDLNLPMAVLQCYRHLFFPSKNPTMGTTLPVAHTVMELSSSSKLHGQDVLKEYLEREGKLLESGDEPDDPRFLRDQTPLRQRGFISTLELRNEYRKSPKLAIVLDENPVIVAIRKGIQDGVFILKQGTQVWGKGDGLGQLPIDSETLIYTIEQAIKDNLWPRAEPLVVTLSIGPDEISQGQSAQIRLKIAGGIGPYKIECSEPTLSADTTKETDATARIFPAASAVYKATVTDARGNSQVGSAQVYVKDQSGTVKPPTLIVPQPTPQPPPPADLRENGPLSTALKDLFERARSLKYSGITSLTVTLNEIGVAGKLHSSAATFKGAAVRCEFSASVTAEGMESLEVNFVGTPEKANPVKNFLDPQIRASSEADFSAIYTFTFEPVLSLEVSATDSLTRDLTRFGAGDAYVEARAIQAGRVGAA